MGWDGSMAFRDCPWCGLTHGQMRVLAAGQQVQTPRNATRFYSWLSCPACGGTQVLEVNSPNSSPPRVIDQVPHDPNAVESVEHLPEDVAKYFGDARRVLRAGVPDAAAVQLRRTLEAAAAHRGV